jgi:hypothetical protein
LWRHIWAVWPSLSLFKRAVVVIWSVVVLLLRLGGSKCTSVVILSAVVLLLPLGGDKCTAVVILSAVVLLLPLGGDKCTAVVILSVVVLLPRLGRDKCAAVVILSVRVCLVKRGQHAHSVSLAEFGARSPFHSFRHRLHKVQAAAGTAPVGPWRSLRTGYRLREILSLTMLAGGLPM